MDDPPTGVAAAVVGGCLAAVGVVKFVLPGVSAPSPEPLATGVLVVGAGGALLVAGVVAVRAALDHLALRLATGVGLLALALAVLRPAALRFGGAVWFGLLFAALVAAGAARTVGRARR